ncbi:MAG: AI-2E family transporter [Planctomycetota bacterium]
MTDTKTSPGKDDTEKLSLGQGRPGAPFAARTLVALGLWALVVVLMFYYGNATRFVLLGGVAALSLSAVLQPLADRLPGPSGLRAGLAVAIFLIVAAALLGTLGYAIHQPVSQSIQDWPQTRTDINAKLKDIAESFGVTGQATVAEIGDIAGRILTGGSASRWIGNVAGAILNTLLAIIVVIIASMYLLARPNGSLAGKAVELLPPGRQKPTLDALDDLRPELRWWVIGTAFSMAVVGMVFGAGYVLIGLKFAIPLALFAAVAQAVPTFGPMVTLLVSLLVAVSQGVTQVVGVVGIYVVVQSIESYLLTPMVMQRAVRMPPVITLFTIVLWGNVFGVAGLFLAIPLDLAIWVLLKHHILMQHRSETDSGGNQTTPQTQGEPSRENTGKSRQAETDGPSVRTGSN